MFVFLRRWAKKKKKNLALEAEWRNYTDIYQNVFNKFIFCAPLFWKKWGMWDGAKKLQLEWEEREKIFLLVQSLLSWQWRILAVKNKRSVQLSLIQTAIIILFHLSRTVYQHFIFIFLGHHTMEMWLTHKSWDTVSTVESLILSSYTLLVALCKAPCSHRPLWLYGFQSLLTNPCTLRFSAWIKLKYFIVSFLDFIINYSNHKANVFCLLLQFLKKNMWII